MSEQPPLGRAVQELRERRGLSKRDAATRAGISETTWRNLESGTLRAAAGVAVPYTPTPATLRKVAGVFGSDASALAALAGIDLDEEAAESPTAARAVDDLRELLRSALASVEVIGAHLREGG